MSLGIESFCSVLLERFLPMCIPVLFVIPFWTMRSTFCTNIICGRDKCFRQRRFPLFLKIMLRPISVTHKFLRMKEFVSDKLNSEFYSFFSIWYVIVNSNRLSMKKWYIVCSSILFLTFSNSPFEWNDFFNGKDFFHSSQIKVFF